MKKLLLGTLCMICAVSASAGEDLVLWTGSQSVSWSKSLEVSTIEAYGKSGTGDKIKISFTGSGSLKLANQTPWKEFDMRNVSGGSYEYTMTQEAAITFIPGKIALQGSGITITKVAITTNHGDKLFDDDLSDPEPRPECKFFDLSTGYYYGLSYDDKDSSKLNFQKYGAVGWYVPNGADLSGIKTIKITADVNWTRELYLNICYGPSLQDVYSHKINRNIKEVTIDMKSDAITKKSDFKKVIYAGLAVKTLGLNVTKMTVKNLKFTVTDVNGKTWVYTGSGVDNIGMDSDVISVDYYDMQGMPVNADAKGIVIERRHYSDGSVKTFKTIK